EKAAQSVSAKLVAHNIYDEPLAMIHPAAAFETKQWPAENFARVIDEVAVRGLRPVVIVAPKEKQILDSVVQGSSARVIGFDDLSLPEVTALAARSQLFVGNDSGIAHMAAAVNTPCVVVFGSSNVAHWRPWTTNRHEVVREEMKCQPCHGYFCAEFERPECILRIPVERVVAAIDRLMRETNP
ncbi:MAG TPA: glycosyltransferase family 9 protein, partial [Pyrinomonadaceae bacterium]|nr:glycosyltransferase family 9 protein [Pyrinomonadaceae bacterium]